MKIFLDVNARVDVFDQEARSALHLAAESGNADICEMLLAKNAYVNSKTKAGWTPLHYVAFNGFNELIHPLVTKHNAAIDATSMVSHTKELGSFNSFLHLKTVMLMGLTVVCLFDCWCGCYHPITLEPGLMYISAVFAR